MSDGNGVSVVLVTASDEVKAAELGRALVDEGLIACATIVPGVRSLYRWQGKLCDEREAQLLLKIRSADFEAVLARVKALHPSQVPEILELKVEGGNQHYLDWVLAPTR